MCPCICLAQKHKGMWRMPPWLSDPPCLAALISTPPLEPLSPTPSPSPLHSLSPGAYSTSGVVGRSSWLAILVKKERWMHNGSVHGGTLRGRVGLLFIYFSPLAQFSSTWWSSALNMQFALTALVTVLILSFVCSSHVHFVTLLQITQWMSMEYVNVGKKMWLQKYYVCKERETKTSKWSFG